MIRALGIVEEIKLLLSTLVSNPVIANNEEARKKVFEELSGVWNRYGDSIREARKSVCRDCDGSGLRRWNDGQCTTCWGTE